MHGLVMFIYLLQNATSTMWHTVMEMMFPAPTHVNLGEFLIMDAPHMNATCKSATNSTIATLNNNITVKGQNGDGCIQDRPM